MKALRYVKYLSLLARIIQALEEAGDGEVPIRIRGIRVGGKTWDLDGTARRRVAG
jgi:hypothetical protein